MGTDAVEFIQCNHVHLRNGPCVLKLGHPNRHMNKDGIEWEGKKDATHT